MTATKHHFINDTLNKLHILSSTYPKQDLIKETLEFSPMIYFCPNCSNLLSLCKSPTSDNELSCFACPYVHKIETSVTKTKRFVKKAVDDILGGSGAWDNVDSTLITCSKCEHDRAYFLMIQIRSADEPMSIFYRCCSCSHQWREG
jgi:DNA-directed RNA polymerase III subunit RPC11